MQTEPSPIAASAPLHVSIQRLNDLRMDKDHTAEKLACLESAIELLERQVADRIVNGETTGNRLTDFAHVCHHDDPAAASKLEEQLKAVEDRLVGHNGALILLAECAEKHGHWLYLGRLVGEELFFDLENKQWSLPTDGHVDVLGFVKSDMPIRLQRRTEPWKADFRQLGNAESLELVPSTRAPAELTHEFYIGNEATLERIITPRGEANNEDYKNGIRHAIKCLRKLGIDPGKYPILIEEVKEDREHCLNLICSYKAARDERRLEIENTLHQDRDENLLDLLREAVRALKIYVIEAIELGLEDDPLVKSLREEYKL